MHILICDDTNAYSLALRKNLEDIFKDLSIDAAFTLLNNLEDLKRCLESQKVDVLFLDIMIGEKSSIDWWLENIHTQSPNIVFMTSFPEEAYNLSQINNAMFMVKTRTDQEYLEKLVLKLVANIIKAPTDLITIKVGNVTHTLKTSSIIYVESFGNNLLIHLQQETIKARCTISSFLKRLPINFLRIHKSYVINMNYVVRTESNQFVLEGNTVLHVNPRKFAELEKKYKKYIELL